MGYVASEWSSPVRSCSCTSVHWYRHIIKAPWGVGGVVLRARCLRGHSVLSPILLVGSRRGALVLVRARAHGGEAIAEGDVDAIPGIRSIDSRLS